MIKLYIIGLSILIVAIAANYLITKIGLLSWYDFLNELSQKGLSSMNSISLLDYIWLFIGYPLVLGFGYWIGYKIHALIFG